MFKGVKSRPVSMHFSVCTPYCTSYPKKQTNKAPNQGSEYSVCVVMLATVALAGRPDVDVDVDIDVTRHERHWDCIRMYVCRDHTLAYMFVCMYVCMHGDKTIGASAWIGLDCLDPAVGFTILVSATVSVASAGISIHS